MGLIEIFFNKQKAIGQFVSEKAYNNNRHMLLKFTPEVMEQMRTLDLPEDKKIKLEYTFYTNTIEKAGHLAFEMEKLGYTVNHGPDLVKTKLFIVTGWTTALNISDENMLSWTEKMCELGYQFDCEFDGWMTDTEPK